MTSSVSGVCRVMSAITVAWASRPCSFQRKAMGETPMLRGKRHGAFSIDHRARAFAAPALHVYGHRQLTDVRVGPFDVDGHRGLRAAEALRADAGLIDQVEQL